MMAEKINIILATDKNYAQHAAVAMASALVNCQCPDRLRFFVIDDNIDNINKKKMQKSVEKLGGSLSFIKAHEEALQNVFVSGNLTRAAYFRLDIPNIVPDDVQKVIYMDCDLLVLADLQKLWDMDMQGKPVAAAEDFGILSSAGKCAEKEKNLEWKKEYSYFNSGVLVMDIAAWRKNDYAQKLIALVATRNFRHHDQDALNLLFMHNWAKMPLCWNVIPPVFNMMLRIVWQKSLRTEALQALNNICIMHYAGGYKPWEYVAYAGFNEKYYEYLSVTEYKDVTMPQPNLKKKGHSISRQLWRMKWAKLVKKLLG